MAKTVVMIHGMWGTGDVWRNYRPLFEAAGYTVITPTLRHHKKSDHQPNPVLGQTSIADYVADVAELIQSLPEKPIIVGHSMGGLIAQLLTSQGLSTQTVLLTPAPPAGIMATRFTAIRTFASVLTQWGFWRRPIRVSYKEAQYGIMNQMDSAMQIEKYNEYAFESGRAAAEIAFWQLDKHKTTRVDARQVTVPMLVVGAEQDRIVPASVVRQVAKKYNATYVELKGMAHAVLEQPRWQEVAHLVLDWLE